MAGSGTGAVMKFTNTGELNPLGAAALPLAVDEIASQSPFWKDLDAKNAFSGVPVAPYPLWLICITSESPGLIVYGVSNMIAVAHEWIPVAPPSAGIEFAAMVKAPVFTTVEVAK